MPELHFTTVMITTYNRTRNLRIQFRKVNRERNFWIYHHPLFHRDRPQDLKKLRRRTCPGFDGRKQRIHRSSTGEEQNVMEAPLTSSATVSPAATTNLVSPGSVAKVSRSPSPSSQNSVERKMVTSNIPFYRSVSSASSIETPDRSPFHRHDKVSHEHNQDCTAHLQIVSQVSRDLNGICSDLSSKRGQRRGMDMCFGLDKPEVHYSKIKCDLLTYDDEFGQKDQERVVFEKSTMPSLPRERFDLTPPSADEAIAISITSALCQQNTFNLGSNASREKDVPFAILMFLLTTHPQDPNILSKIHAELICNPSLREEFHAYSQALDGTDLKQVWCNFARNEVHPLMKSTFYNYKVMSEEKMNVFHKCYALWFDAT
jgi:hypothetical protein